jgi:hypothetical protein
MTQTIPTPEPAGGRPAPHLDCERLDCYRVAIEFQTIAAGWSRTAGWERCATSSTAPGCRSSSTSRRSRPPARAREGELLRDRSRQRDRVRRRPGSASGARHRLVGRPTARTRPHRPSGADADAPDRAPRVFTARSWIEPIEALLDLYPVFRLMPNSRHSALIPSAASNRVTKALLIGHGTALSPGHRLLAMPGNVSPMSPVCFVTLVPGLYPSGRGRGRARVRARPSRFQPPVRGRGRARVRARPSRFQPAFVHVRGRPRPIRRSDRPKTPASAARCSPSWGPGDPP